MPLNYTNCNKNNAPIKKGVKNEDRYKHREISKR